MTRYNSENMLAELDRFGRAYKYPINVSVTRLTGLFGTDKEIMQGYAAVVTEGFLLLALIPADVLLDEPQYHKLPVLGMSCLKVKKSPEMDVYTIKANGTEDGNRYKYIITAVGKSDKESFPQQYKNCNGFIGLLTKWSKEL